MNLEEFESQFDERMRDVCAKHPDPSHDILHVRRVVKNAKLLARLEGAAQEVVVPAAYLHDVVYVSKTDPRRPEASLLSAIEARSFLTKIGYPEIYFNSICHAIEAHSFSASKEAQTIEAKVVQDADRLDALGAIGIARCLAFSGIALRPIYQSDDPFCNRRKPDDGSNTLDHFYTKLFKLPDKMQTEAGRVEALRRLKIMEAYVDALRTEL